MELLDGEKSLSSLYLILFIFYMHFVFRVTGFTFFKIGKATAAAIGSGIFILQIANHNGYIKINWDKVTKKAEELSEKIDENSSKPNLMQKVSIFLL